MSLAKLNTTQSGPRICGEGPLDNLGLDGSDRHEARREARAALCIVGATDAYATTRGLSDDRICAPIIVEYAPSRAAERVGGLAESLLIRSESSA